jgi:hypothetical protein
MHTEKSVTPAAALTMPRVETALERAFRKFPGLEALDEFFQGHERMQQVKAGTLEPEKLHHRKCDLRSQLMQWDEHAKQCRKERSPVKVLELGCVDHRLLDRYFSTDLDLNTYVRKSGAGPALMPVEELKLLFEAFKPGAFVVTGHSDCKAFNHALKHAFHCFETFQKEEKPADVIAYSVIDKIRNDLNRGELDLIVENLDEMRYFPSLQRKYAELNMAFTRGQLGYLLEKSPEIRAKAEQGRHILASAFQDVETHRIFLDVRSLDLNAKLKEDPVMFEAVKTHFAKYHYGTGVALPQFDA